MKVDLLVTREQREQRTWAGTRSGLLFSRAGCDIVEDFDFHELSNENKSLKLSTSRYRAMGKS